MGETSAEHESDEEDGKDNSINTELSDISRDSVMLGWYKWQTELSLIQLLLQITIRDSSAMDLSLIHI